MPKIDTDDAEVAAMAVNALSEAQARAMKSGHDYVIVENDELIHVGPHGRTVLKKLPPRLKVSLESSE